jgi:hypothetical protein
MTPLDPQFWWNYIDQFTHQYMGLFTGTGAGMVGGIATIVFAVYLFRSGLNAMSAVLGFIMEFGIRLGIVSNLEVYYDQPCPWLLGLKVDQVFPLLANYLANTIGLSRLDIFYTHLVDLQKAIATQNFNILTQSAQWFAATCVELMCWALQAVLIGLNMPAYIILGILTLLGPLFIPFFLVPRLSQFSWNWMQATLEYSFYRVIAAGVIWVASTAMTSYMDTMIAGDLSIENLSALAGMFLFMLGAIAWTCFKVGPIVGSLFKGTADAAGGFGSFVFQKVRI